VHVHVPPVFVIVFLLDGAHLNTIEAYARAAPISYSEIS
jgi:hypothetical protein